MGFGRWLEACKAAYEWLMGDASSAYASFIGEHECWLRMMSTPARWPFRGLLRQFLENALWPDLYPHRSWCDTRWAGSEHHRRSPKASFLVKVTSSIVEYGSSMELLQFHYDRDILAKLTGKARAARAPALARGSRRLLRTCSRGRRPRSP